MSLPDKITAYELHCIQVEAKSKADVDALVAKLDALRATERPRVGSVGDDDDVRALRATKPVKE